MTRKTLLFTFVLAGCNSVSAAPQEHGPENLSTNVAASTAVTAPDQLSFAEPASSGAVGIEFETLPVPDDALPAKAGAETSPRPHPIPVRSGEPTSVPASKPCPPIGFHRCAGCKPPRCVDGRWVSPEPEKTCSAPPPPCAGAIGFCPSYQCKDGRWVATARDRFDKTPHPRL